MVRTLSTVSKASKLSEVSTGADKYAQQANGNRKYNPDFETEGWERTSSSRLD